MTISEFRKTQGITQEQFAALIGNSVSAVRNWEQIDVTAEKLIAGGVVC